MEGNFVTTFYKAPSKNFVQLNLDGSINASQDTITLNDASDLNFPGAIVVDRLDANGTSTPASREVITYTGITGNQLTGCTRGVDGTIAQSHSDQARVDTVLTVGMYNDLITSVSNVIATNGDVTAEILDPKVTKQNIVTSSDGATITFDLDTSNVFKVVLGGNRTLAVSNPDVGQTFIIRLTQDGTGGRTVTWFSTIKWAGGVEPILTTTGDKTDTFGFICTGTDEYDGYIVGQGL